MTYCEDALYSIASEFREGVEQAIFKGIMKLESGEELYKFLIMVDGVSTRCLVEDFLTKEEVRQYVLPNELNRVEEKGNV
jgi:hypothetical protein